MEDLGKQTGHPDEILLGGGNPAHIPEAEAVFQETFTNLAKVPALRALLGDYQAPIGNDHFREIAAEYLSSHFGTSLRKENIAFFNGSQNAYSYLLNLHSGPMADGSFKKILLPIVPEYIGYADQTITEGVFVANTPMVKQTGKNRFQYELNKTSFDLTDIGVLAISRPTNPTGNVINLSDLEWMEERTKKQNIPILIDLAYGNPFPNLIGKEEPIHFGNGRTLSLSFSKIGLPGVRLGIVISDEDTIETLSSFAAVGNLAVGNLGVYMMEQLFQKTYSPNSQKTSYVRFMKPNVTSHWHYSQMRFKNWESNTKSTTPWVVFSFGFGSPHFPLPITNCITFVKINDSSSYQDIISFLD